MMSLPGNVISQRPPIALLHALTNSTHNVVTQRTNLIQNTLTHQLLCDIPGTTPSQDRTKRDTLTNQPQIGQRVKGHIPDEPQRGSTKLLPTTITILHNIVIVEQTTKRIVVFVLLCEIAPTGILTCEQVDALFDGRCGKRQRLLNSV